MFFSLTPIRSFAHGIDIIGMASYFTLVNRTRAYLNVQGIQARSVEHLKRHLLFVRAPLVNHLAEVKLFHWDISVRVLAASALHNMTLLCLKEQQETIRENNVIMDRVIPALIPKATHAYDPNIRHGALLGIAQILLAIHNSTTALTMLPRSVIVQIREIVPILKRQRLFHRCGFQNGS